jgi:hypothetical protein
MTIAQPPLKKPTTYVEIVEAMQRLGLPVLRAEIAQQLAPAHRKQIAEALWVVMSRADNARKVNGQLQCVCTAFAPGAARVLENLGIGAVPADILFSKALEEGEALRTALQSLIEQFDADCTDAETVRRIFGAASKRAEADKRPPEQSPPARQQPQRAAESGRPDEREREGTGARGDDRYPPARTQVEPASRGELAPARAMPASFHVYAKSYALTIQEDYSDNQKMHTLRLEIAKSTGPRAYDWKGKVAVQLSRKELPLLLGVMTGKLAKLDASGHGEGNTKYFSVEDQGANWYLKMGIKDGLNGALPLLAEDCYRLIPMILAAMRRNDPVLESNKDVYDIVAMVCGKHAQRAGGRGQARE